MINITNSAKEYIINVVKEADSRGISVEAVKGGCSGMQFKFALEKEDINCDKIVVSEGIFLFIKQSAVLFVAGSILNYKKTMTGSMLVFEKTNFKGRCGCGKSFY